MGLYYRQHGFRCFHSAISEVYPRGCKEIQFIVSAAAEYSIARTYIHLSSLLVMDSLVDSSFQYQKQLCDEYFCAYLLMVLRREFLWSNIPGVQFAGSHGRAIFTFTKDYQIDLQNGHIGLHFFVHEGTWYPPTFGIRFLTIVWRASVCSLFNLHCFDYQCYIFSFLFL